MAGWIDYWNRKDTMSGEFWRKQAFFFADQIIREIPFGPDDVVLDIGCGKGHVLAALASRIREGIGLDTSAACIEESIARYGTTGNLRFQTLPQDYLAIDSLSLKPPTRILCVSVAQYYKSLDELQTLIRNARKIAAPGCRMLIADLLTDYNLIKDITGVLWGGLLSGMFVDKVREAFSGKHALYKRIRSDNPVLTMRRRDVKEICAAEKASLRFISRNLTGNCFRDHALLSFDGPAA